MGAFLAGFAVAGVGVYHTATVSTVRSQPHPPSRPPETPPPCPVPSSSIARSCRAAVLAGLPRPDQPGRRDRQWAPKCSRTTTTRKPRPLRSSSSRKAPARPAARLQFCRLAFGAAGSAGAQIDLGDAETVARGFLEDDKTKLAWNLPRVLLPKNRVKLLLNLLLLAGGTIPRGGMLVLGARSAPAIRWASRSRRPGSMRAFRRRAGLLAGGRRERHRRCPCDPAVLRRPVGAHLRALPSRAPERRRRSCRPLAPPPERAACGPADLNRCYWASSGRACRARSRDAILLS